MNCPNCGRESKPGGVCPECKVDPVLFAGTLKISDTLYNRGLAKAKAGDLSGAQECLVKSVQTNKNNVFARNLLGLVLFETGRIGEAFKEWVISQSLMRDKNPAVMYLEEANKNGRLLEGMNESIRMYNQALEYLNQQSDDIALIQLKKAVECNPKFIDALNLLTLCYLIQSERDRAALTAERVLSMDNNNTIALNYYAELNPGRTRPDLRQRRVQNAPQPAAPSLMSNYNKVVIPEKKSTNFHIAEILSFIIGSACMFAVLYVLVFPSLTREDGADTAGGQPQIGEESSAYGEEMGELLDEISKLNSEIALMQTKIEDREYENDILDRINKVLLANDYFKDGRYQDAIDVMNNIGKAGLPADILQTAENIVSTALPQLAKQYYDDGVQAHDKDNDNDKALVDFEKSKRYMESSSPYYDNLLYYLGLLYVQNGNRNEQALNMFKELSNRNPEYVHIDYVNNQIDKLNEIMGE